MVVQLSMKYLCKNGHSSSLFHRNLPLTPPTSIGDQDRHLQCEDWRKARIIMKWENEESEERSREGGNVSHGNHQGAYSQQSVLSHFPILSRHLWLYYTKIDRKEHGKEKKRSEMAGREGRRRNWERRRERMEEEERQVHSETSMNSHYVIRTLPFNCVYGIGEWRSMFPLLLQWSSLRGYLTQSLYLPLPSSSLSIWSNLK